LRIRGGFTEEAHAVATRIDLINRRELVAVLGIEKWYDVVDGWHNERKKFAEKVWEKENGDLTAIGFKSKDGGRSEI